MNSLIMVEKSNRRSSFLNSLHAFKHGFGRKPTHDASNPKKEDKSSDQRILSLKPELELALRPAKRREPSPSPVSSTALATSTPTPRTYLPYRYSSHPLPSQYPDRPKPEHPCPGATRLIPGSVSQTVRAVSPQPRQTTACEFPRSVSSGVLTSHRAQEAILPFYEGPQRGFTRSGLPLSSKTRTDFRSDENRDHCERQRVPTNQQRTSTQRESFPAYETTKELRRSQRYRATRPGPPVGLLGYQIDSTHDINQIPSRRTHQHLPYPAQPYTTLPLPTSSSAPCMRNSKVDRLSRVPQLTSTIQTRTIRPSGENPLPPRREPARERCGGYRSVLEGEAGAYHLLRKAQFTYYADPPAPTTTASTTYDSPLYRVSTPTRLPLAGRSNHPKSNMFLAKRIRWTSGCENLRRLEKYPEANENTRPMTGNPPSSTEDSSPTASKTAQQSSARQREHIERMVGPVSVQYSLSPRRSSLFAKPMALIAW